MSFGSGGDGFKNIIRSGKEKGCAGMFDDDVNSTTGIGWVSLSQCSMFRRLLVGESFYTCDGVFIDYCSACIVGDTTVAAAP